MKHFEDIERKLPQGMRLKYYCTSRLWWPDNTPEPQVTDNLDRLSADEFKVNAMGHDYISSDKWSEAKTRLRIYRFENVKFKYYDIFEKRVVSKCFESWDVEAFTYGQAKNILEAKVLGWCTKSYKQYAVSNNGIVPPVTEFDSFMRTGLTLVPALLFLGDFSYTYKGQSPIYGGWDYNHGYVIRKLLPSLGLIPDVLVKQLGYEDAVEYVRLCAADENMIKAVTTPGLFDAALEYCSQFWDFTEEEIEVFKQASLTDRSPKVSIA